ncbi:RNA-binding protein [Nocardiopsis sp. CNT-189]|uniref:RNA-binding protein n=1 Tax=Nocardiopsis oceanisediminis TaxID=2816862 RepID=UPI003B2E56E2
MLPHVHRVTKYDPAHRDRQGRYTGPEDTDSDRGPVEAAYLRAVAAFAEEAGVGFLSVREPALGPEPSDGDLGAAALRLGGTAGFHDGARIPLRSALELVRTMLRGGAWCRLEAEGAFAVHVGWDQYVYVGSARPCPRAAARTRALGLFPEPLDASPYDIAFDAEPGGRRPADAGFWALLHRCTAAGRAGLLEEEYATGAVRRHLLTPGTLRRVRAGLAPRARLEVWPPLSGDVGAVLVGLPREDPVELLWADAEGAVRAAEVEEGTGPEQAAALVRGARAAALLPVYLDDRAPLLTAVLPDPDGVLRARWRTAPAATDRA